MFNKDYKQKDSVAADEITHYKLSNLDLHCLRGLCFVNVVKGSIL